MRAPNFQDSHTTLYQGDAREVLRTLPERSVQCVVTSPPYWGLRDYKLPASVWAPTANPHGVLFWKKQQWRIANCLHEWGEERLSEAGRNDGGRDIGGRAGNYQGDGPHKSDISQGAFCRLCGAWRGTLGLEPTPELYVEHMVAVFREIRRVLRDDGTVWLNLGDSYAAVHQYQANRTVVRPCILAGTSERACECGAPWERVTEREYRSPIITTGTEEGRYESGRNRNVTRMGDGVDVTTTGWRPTCAHEAETQPCTVLDPFAGSGTTALVARKAGRRAILIELSESYAAMIVNRIGQGVLL